MGFEYEFKLSQIDIDMLSRAVDGIHTIDQLLQNAPSFVGKADVTYFFGERSMDMNRWPSTVTLQDDGFFLCIYDRASTSEDMTLMGYLIHELLHRCGHVEVSEDQGSSRLNWNRH